MQGYLAMCMKTKDSKNEVWESLAMLLKNKYVTCFLVDVYENERHKGL